MKATLGRLIWLLLFSVLVYSFEAGADTVLRDPFMLQDFERPDLINNLIGKTWAWTEEDPLVPSDPHLASRINREAGREGHVLHWQYRFKPDSSGRVGFRMALEGINVHDNDHLELWIKGDSRQGFSPELKIQFVRPLDKSPSLRQSGSFILGGITDQWQRFRIPLNMMTGINNWTHLEQFVISLHGRRADKPAGAYSIDDIALIKTQDPGPSARDKVAPVKKNAWVRTLDPDKVKSQLQARLNGWPTKLLQDKRRLPRDDQAFLLRIASDTWRGMAAMTDRENGLPLDNIGWTRQGVTLEYSKIGDYTNITNIGVYMLAVVAARELGFITANEAFEQLAKLLSTLDRLETYNGFFYNYYDTTTLERTSHFISTVDLAWLTAGLMVVRNAVPRLWEHCTGLIDDMDYGRLYDDVEQLMSQGYYTNLKTASEFHYGLLYTEARVGSLIAIGKGDVPEEHWLRIHRTLPKKATWQVQAPQEQVAKTVGKYKVMNGYYQWQGIKYVPSWGGSMFEALMPTLVLDEQKYAPKSLGLNNRKHITVQRQYALEGLRYPVWGMSPSSSVARNGYSEWGVRVLGSRGYKSGVISAHAAVLPITVLPEVTVENMRKLVELYDLYGEFGFYDAVDPASGQVSYKYLMLDQSMILIPLANYLREGVIQKYFAADPIAQRALPVIAQEQFID